MGPVLGLKVQMSLRGFIGISQSIISLAEMMGTGWCYFMYVHTRRYMLTYCRAVVSLPTFFAWLCVPSVCSSPMCVLCGGGGIRLTLVMQSDI